MYIDYDFENPFLIIDEEENLLLPLNLFISFSESHIDTIPAIRESVETLAGVDGDVPYDSTYSPRLFDLLCYTPDGLTNEQKVIYKQHISYTLDQLKQTAKPLLWQGKIYMVRLCGAIQPIGYASFFNGAIQLKANNPFGYSQKVYILKKDGIVRYNGNTKNGMIIEISGSLTNPFVTINGNKISYTGIIPVGAVLTIDTENQQAFLTNSDGTMTDAINEITGLNRKVQFNVSTTVIVNGIIEFQPYKNIVTMSNPDNTTIKWREKSI